MNISDVEFKNGKVFEDIKTSHKWEVFNGELIAHNGDTNLTTWATLQDIASMDFKEVFDWNTVKPDTKILVSQDGNEWHRAYFAEYKNRSVYAFLNGGTSWNASTIKLKRWKYAKLAESEETRCD